MKELLDKISANVKKFGIAITAGLGAIAVTLTMLSSNIKSIKEFVYEYIVNEKKQEQVVARVETPL